MRYIWRSRKAVDIPTFVWLESKTIPGVRFSIRQISLGSRLELMNGMRELVAKTDFLRAGNLLEQTEAVISDLMAKSLYLRWGLQDVEGLTVDGRRVTTESLIEAAPEILCNEIVAAIRGSLELSEAERKNS